MTGWEVRSVAMPPSPQRKLGSMPGQSRETNRSHLGPSSTPLPCCHCEVPCTVAIHGDAPRLPLAARSVARHGSPRPAGALDDAFSQFLVSCAAPQGNCINPLSGVRGSTASPLTRGDRGGLWVVPQRPNPSPALPLSGEGVTVVRVGMFMRLPCAAPLHAPAPRYQAV